MANDERKNRDRNPDPITGEPGSHPIGTGLGGAAGGAAGFAAGAPAGPIGAAAGGTLGALGGAIGGKAAGEAVDPTTTNPESSENYGSYSGRAAYGQQFPGSNDRLIGCDVVDSKGEKIGTVESIWQDQSDDPEFLAIRTGWFGLGKIVIVPADAAGIQVTGRRIRVPYTADVVKNAPQFSSEDDINDDTEHRIQSYYERHGLQRRRTALEGRGGMQAPSTDAPLASAEVESFSATADARSDADFGERTLAEDETLELKKENLRVDKRAVEQGGMRLRKIVRSEDVEVPVTLEREEAHIERVPADRPADPDATFDEEEIFIPLRREEPVVDKEVVVAEEVRVTKESHQESETVRGEVRSEDVEVLEDPRQTKPSDVTLPR